MDTRETVSANGTRRHRKHDGGIVFLARLMDNASLPFAVAGGDGEIIVCNRAFCSLLGYERDGLKGKTWLELTAPEDRDEEIRRGPLLQDAGSRGMRYEKHYLKADGTKVPVQVIAARFRGKRGNDYACAVVTDITDQRLTEDSLRIEKAYFEELFESSPEAIVIENPRDLSVERVNRSFCRLFGFRESEVLGRGLNDIIVPKEFLDEKKAPDWNAVSKGAVSIETTRLTRDGKRIDVSMLSTEVRGPEGRLAYYTIYRDISDRLRAEGMLQENIETLKRIWEQTMKALAAAVEARDIYTAGHQRRVAVLAEAIAKRMDYSPERIEQVRLAAMVHDIGKVYVPGEILNRPGPLQPVEMRLVQAHSAYGRDILSNIEVPWPLAQIVYEHHERLDGSGYPQGLRGPGILPEARILAVADIVEAMCTHRPYRPAKGLEAAKKEILALSGVQLDFQVVAACLDILADGNPWGPGDSENGAGGGKEA